MTLEEVSDTDRERLARWAELDVERIKVDANGKVNADDNGDWLEFEVALVCQPDQRCCPPHDGSDTRWLKPSYSPFTDPGQALMYARWQAFYVYGSEHKPKLRARWVNDYEEF